VQKINSFLIIFLCASSFAVDDYFTYAAETFVRVQFCERDKVFIDTLYVLSLTINDTYIKARVVGSDVPVIIRPPDRLERIYAGH
jgi:hypothetical protein